ncbi:MAG: 50S ribosomal protein L11 methyltransferase [Mycobacteriales bacterium]
MTMSRPLSATTSYERLAAAGVRAQLARIEELVTSTRAAVDAIASGTVDQSTLGALAANVIPRWHFSMLNDRERNDAYATALERQVVPGSHVLDIGSGSGLLALAAARAGAGRVTTCEANPLLAEVARQIIDTQGLTDRITVLATHSSAIEIGREIATPADMVISEIVDCGLVGEGILPSIRHARRELLAPDGTILPQGAKLYGQLMESSAVQRLNHVEVACGFDVSLMNALATHGHFPTRLATWPHCALSAPVELLSFDFTRDVPEQQNRSVSFEPTTSGTAHAVVAWFELDLGAGVVLRTTPDNTATHWMQAFLPFPAPVEVAAGRSIEVELRCVSTRLSATPTRVCTEAPSTTQEATR